MFLDKKVAVCSESVYYNALGGDGCSAPVCSRKHLLDFCVLNIVSLLLFDLWEMFCGSKNVRVKEYSTVQHMLLSYCQC